MTQDALFQAPPNTRTGINLNTPTPRPTRPEILAQVAWVADQLRPRATARHCQTCRQVIISGPCAIGIPARVDPTPLNAMGEAIALLTGRATFELIAWTNRFELRLRTAHRIRAHPIGGTAYSESIGKYDVLVEHQCHSPELPTTNSVHEIPKAPTNSDMCPFENWSSQK